MKGIKTLGGSRNTLRVRLYQIKKVLGKGLHYRLQGRNTLRVRLYQIYFVIASDKKNYVGVAILCEYDYIKSRKSWEKDCIIGFKVAILCEYDYIKSHAKLHLGLS